MRKIMCSIDGCSRKFEIYPKIEEDIISAVCWYHSDPEIHFNLQEITFNSLLEDRSLS